MTENSESWNGQLFRWYNNSGETMKKIQEKTGIPRSSFGDYIYGRTKDLNKISTERRRLLYNLTGLECFKHGQRNIVEIAGSIEEPLKETQGKKIAEIIFSEYVKKTKASIDDMVSKNVSDLSGIEKLERGLLKSQLYQPTTDQRVGAIMELLDVLAEEVDYFRTASDKEKMVLVRRLKEDIDSFQYVSQMVNILYKGEGLNTLMAIAQPPSKIKKALNKKK